MINIFEFRAWHKELRLMFDVFGIDKIHVYSFMQQGLEIPPNIDEVILLLYTGLQDTKNNKAFQNDYIVYIDYDGCKHVALIELGKYKFQLREIMDHGKTRIRNIKILEKTQFIIIGNKYENNKKEIIKLYNKIKKSIFTEELNYNQARRYLFEGYIIKNSFYQYRLIGQKLFCKNNKFDAWQLIETIPNNEKNLKWKIIKRK